MLTRVLPWLVVFFSLHAQAQENLVPQVVSSIKPIHSLAANLLEGVPVGQAVLVDGAASPHGFELKPSQRQMLEHAAVVFYVSPEFESFLEKPLKDLPKTTKTVALANQARLNLLRLREGGMWDAHDDEESSHDEHEHHKKEMDAHVWTNPLLAIKMADAMADTLAEAIPEHKAKISNNLIALKKKLQALDEATFEQFTKEKPSSYLVFHDAYQYFERRYGVRAAGSIKVHPETPMSARRLAEIKNKIIALNIQCLFKEPQFETDLPAKLDSKKTLKIYLLDPLGASYSPSKDLYFNMIRDISHAISKCTKPIL